VTLTPPPAFGNDPSLSDRSLPKFETLRRIETRDLEQIVGFAYTVSITEPLTDLDRLREVHAATGLWTADSGALARMHRVECVIGGS
jgi:hypothetical protein